jgi:hypothetical protein
MSLAVAVDLVAELELGVIAIVKTGIGPRACCHAGSHDRGVLGGRPGAGPDRYLPWFDLSRAGSAGLAHRDF